MKENVTKYKILKVGRKFRILDRGHFLRDLNVIFGRSIVEVMAKVYLRRIGLLALFVEPILLAGIYFLLSLIIFPSSLTSQYFLGIFASLLVFRGFQKPLEAATVSVVSSSELIRSGVLTAPQILFGSWLTEVLLGLMVLPILLIFTLLLGVQVSFSFLFIPLCFFLSTLLALILSPILAWLGIAFRGSVAILLPLISLLWYFTPAIYDSSRVASRFQSLYAMNPLAQLVQRTKLIYVSTDSQFELIPILTLIILITTGSFIVVKIFDVYYYRMSKYL